ncbi:proton-conducting transporter membrane subunit [Sphingobium estronivorans]|uniref:proton-conducting transporter transmembrane domain-containing protein n=1 Tax=Sphingobium estronivorans TaxID=1577690 RepID=UPI00123C32FC|nr:proton-conducting transporter membrane subunit [Sphingobium estronivorans]
MTTGTLIVLLLLCPAIAVAGSLAGRSPRLAEAINLLASIGSFAVAVALVWRATPEPVIYGRSYIALDALGAWVILCAAIVYLLSSIYAIGYMRMLDEDERLPGFYALFAGFALTIFVGPLMNNPGLYWIAIELTTLVSTFLVAFEHEASSIEAAWKYIVIVSAGISLALLGTVLFYWSGTFVNGPTYELTWASLTAVAPHASQSIILLSFLLVLVGYGTKVGLAPMHSWLPDAHSESPAPVSALLSGALLNTAMLGVVRFLGVADAAGIGGTCRVVTVALGLLSILVGALFIVRQRGIKRLMAYSSVEHMGVMALGFGFGGILGTAGALYHMLNHSLNKSLMFFGAGNAMRAYQTKDIRGIRDVWIRFPAQAALWLAGAAAITGAPPFGLFQSELAILRAGIGLPHLSWAVYGMALLLIVIFIAFMNQFRLMYLAPPTSAPEERPDRTLSAWCVAPMWLALLPLLLFGLWWPDAMWRYFHGIAIALSGAAS